LNTFLNEYSKQAANGLWISPKIDPISHCALGLTGEAGECADLVKKSQYHPGRLYTGVTMAEEIGDVMWYASNLANLHGYTLEEVLRGNIAKLAIRHNGKGVYDVSRLL
jgi:NTP pyrophosphatase (non-canonical NTP hydrolase)